MDSHFRGNDNKMRDCFVTAFLAMTEEDEEKRKHQPEGMRWKTGFYLITGITRKGS